FPPNSAAAAYSPCPETTAHACVDTTDAPEYANAPDLPGRTTAPPGCTTATPSAPSVASPAANGWPHLPNPEPACSLQTSLPTPSDWRRPTTPPARSSPDTYSR